MQIAWNKQAKAVKNVQILVIEGATKVKRVFYTLTFCHTYILNFSESTHNSLDTMLHRRLNHKYPSCCYESTLNMIEGFEELLSIIQTNSVSKYYKF